MNSDTADTVARAAYAAGARDSAAGALEQAHPRLPAPARLPVPRWLLSLRAEEARMTALRESWRALWMSRLLVWAAAVSSLLAFGFGPVRSAFNPPGVTRGFGWLGNLLAAPAARWDAVWYLVIAHYGYRPDLGAYTAPRAAFFPLYPFGVRAIGWLGLQPVLAGVLLSVSAFALALYGIHRLTTLELGRERRAPMPRAWRCC